jgi:hypothetical protein
MGKSDGGEFKALRGGKAEQGEAGFIRQRLVICGLLRLQIAKDEKGGQLAALTFYGYSRKKYVWSLVIVRMNSDLSPSPPVV